MAETVTSLLRGQFQNLRGWLGGTVGDISSEQLHWQPPGAALPIAAHYAHVVTGEDTFLREHLNGGAPLLATSFAGRTGLSELPPPGFNWVDWGRAVRMDLAAFNTYAQAVYADIDRLLGAMTATDLAKPVDFTSGGLGMRDVTFVINIMLANGFAHTGEISALKGLQGLKGYPF